MHSSFQLIFYRHCLKFLTCGLIFTILVSCLSGAGVSIGVKLWGPETNLVGNVSIAVESQPQEISEYPYFCEEVTVISKSTVKNTTITLYLSNDIGDVIVWECFVDAVKNDSCSLFIPFKLDNILYGRTTGKNDTLISISCRTRIWLYTAISLTVFTIVAIGGLLCSCCCACTFCRAKEEDRKDLFIYQPLLDTADHGPKADPGEQQLMLSSGNQTDGVLPTMHPTELSSSCKYSTFKPGTKPGGSYRPRDRSVKKKAEQKHPKPNYATISGTYTYNTFKPRQ